MAAKKKAEAVKKLSTREGLDRMIARCDQFKVDRAKDISRKRRAGVNMNTIARTFLVKALEAIEELEKDCAYRKLESHVHQG